jgi:hypothetical protein
MRFMKLWVLLVSCALLSACERGCRGAPNASDGPVAQMRTGDGEAPKLSFAIDSIYERHQPSNAAPWHQPGGDWTFFDAHLERGTQFTFGFQQKPNSGSEDMGFSFGKGQLTVPDAEAGAHLLDAFARVFGGQAPAPGSRQPLVAQPISLAVLARSAERNDDGSFSGTGPWTATKLFLQRPGIEAEVFFNFDLAGKHGEFSEKDAEYATDMLAFWARDLRDGPPPPRTPKNDPRVSLSGPKLEQWRPIGPAGARFLAFERSGDRLLYSVEDGARTRLVSSACDGAGSELEVARLPHYLMGLTCAESGDPCLIEDVAPSVKGQISGDDPRAYYLLQRSQKKTTLLPWSKHGSVLTAGFSPDGAYFALGEWRDNTGDKGSHIELRLSSVSEPLVARSVQHGEDSHDVLGWSGEGASSLAVVKRGAGLFDESETSTWLFVDPRTGATTESPTKPPGVRDETVSPDGKRQFFCIGDTEIVVTDLSSGAKRRFPILSQERRAFGDACEVTWVGSRHLLVSIEQEAFIDVETMKLSFPGPDSETHVEYAPTLRWGVKRSDAGLQIARVSVH